jgi:Pseudouridylate synthases, 23S RNA-specific
MKSVAELPSKYLPVPDQLVGERLDNGLAKMLGISRTKAQELVLAGAVMQNSILAGKSDRLLLAGVLEVELVEGPPPIEVKAQDVVELGIVFQDEHLVVIDKPAGVVSHPSQGFEGPSVPGVLLSRGIQLATSGASERQGIVQRLDVGTSGLMVLAKGERAYSVLKQAFRDRSVKRPITRFVRVGQIPPTEPLTPR